MQAIRRAFLRRTLTNAQLSSGFSLFPLRAFCQGALEPECRGESAQTQETPLFEGLADSLEEEEEGQVSVQLQGSSDPLSVVLRAFPRERNENFTERIRKLGLVTAVLADGEHSRWPKEVPDVFLSLEEKQIVNLLKRLGKRDFLCRTFDMKIYSGPHSDELLESLQVLPRNLNYGAGKTHILNVQFLRVPSDKMLKLGVLLEFLGAENCPGIRKGGTLKKLCKHVTYRCRPDQLPAKITVDLTVLEIGDKVLVKHLEVDKDLLDSDECMPVCEITKKPAVHLARMARKAQDGKKLARKIAAGEGQGIVGNLKIGKQKSEKSRGPHQLELQKERKEKLTQIVKCSRLLNQGKERPKDTEFCQLEIPRKGKKSR